MASKATAVSLGTVNERRLRPVYDLLDAGNNKSAVHEADKVLKKQRDLLAAKVLKTIALYRLGKVEEAFALSQDVVAASPTDENSLQGLSLYYRESQRTDLIPPIYEAALQKCPGNEEYMTHLFMSYVRTEKPKDMQRVAINLFKHHPKNPYLFWGVMSIVMQAQDNEQLGKTMFLPLAERMIEKHIEKGNLEAEAETRLYLIVLDLLGKHEKALGVVEGKFARNLSLNVESLEELKTELHKKIGKWEKINSSSKSLFKKDPDIWNHVLDYLQSLERLIECGWKPDESQEAGTSIESADYSWEHAVNLFSEIKNREISENPHRLRRGPFLAVLELTRRMQSSSPSDELNNNGALGTTVDLVMEYADQFSTKQCCFMDLENFVKDLSEEEKSKLLEHVNSVVSTKFSSNENETSNGEVDDKMKEKEIWSHLFYLKMQRYLGFHEILSRGEKLDLVRDLLHRYTEGLHYSEYRPSTDLRVVDDYCLMAANILFDIYLCEGDVELAWKAVYILELAKQKSEVNYKFKFTLIRLYCHFGIFMPCAQIYDSLDIKHVQQDTLGYLVCNPVLALGHYQLASQAFEASRAYFVSNEKDSLEFLISCFKNGTFHKISEFIAFRRRVKSSVHASQTLMEHIYMDLITQAGIEMPFGDLIESNCLPAEITRYEKLTDNRDFSLSFDWKAGLRPVMHEEVRASFNLEKKWLYFREMQVRSLVTLLRNSGSPQKSEDGKNQGDLGSYLEKLQQSIEELKTDSDLQVKFSLHGPPHPRIKRSLESGYFDATLNLLRHFDKIMSFGAKGDENWEESSKSVISGMEASLSPLKNLIGDQSVGTEEVSSHHGCCHGGHCDAVSSVVSDESVESVLDLPVSDSLKKLDRENLERLVLACELFSQTVLLTYSFRMLVAQIKADAVKKRRRKKGKQDPLPSIIQYYPQFVSDLVQVGTKLKLAVKAMQSSAEVMTLDLSKASLKDGEKMSNGISMQKDSEGKDPEESPIPDKSPENDSPVVGKSASNTPSLPDQIVKMASGSLENAVKQLSRIVDGRLHNLKAIKI